MHRPLHSGRPALTLTLALGLASAFAVASARAADEVAPVLPYRPSVSTPAQLPAAGYLEVETGGLRAAGPAGAGGRNSMPLTLKLAFNPQWGVVVGTEAAVRQDDGAGGHASGGGDTTLVLKHCLPLGDDAGLGLELGAKLPTAAAATGGSGHADALLNAIYSADFAGGWHADLNLNEARQGAAAGAAVTWQTGWAAAFSHAVGGDFGAVGELSGSHVHGAMASAQILGAGSWNASRDAVFDLGLAHGLNAATPRLQVFFGVTFRAGKLF